MSLQIEHGWASYKSKNYKAMLAGSFKKREDILDIIQNNPTDFIALQSFLSNEHLSFGLIYQADNYSIAICDRVQGYGIYYDTDGNIYTRLPNLTNGRTDDQSILECASAGYVLGKRTLHQNIQQLQAGEIVYIDKTISPSKITTHRYYRYQPMPAYPERTRDDWVKQLGQTLDNVIDKTIKSLGNAPVCIPLSGGLDSRLLLAKFHEHNKKDIYTFSYGLKNNFEAKTAKKVAEMIGTNWCMVASIPSTARKLYASDKRKAYTAFVHGLSRTPSYVEFEALTTIVENNIVPKNAIIVNGQSGDFISGGHIPACLYENENPIKDDMYRYIFDKHFSLWRSLKTPDREEKIRSHIETLLLPFEPTLSEKDNLMRQYESFEWQERQCKMVVNGQKAYDFFGFDWRLPLWDKELMDFFETVPWELKYKQTLFKEYLKKWNYKNVFDLAAAEPEVWQPHQYWILYAGRALGIIKSKDAKQNFYKKMLYRSDQHFQYALFGQDLYNTHYKDMRNMMSLAALDLLNDQNIAFLGDI